MPGIVIQSKKKEMALSRKLLQFRKGKRFNYCANPLE